jgi:hypothetical protein
MNLLRTTRRRIILGIGVGMAFVAGLALFLAWKHAPERFYTRAPETVVAINGTTVPGAGVYRSSRDVWLIDMGNGTDGTRIHATTSGYTPAMRRNEFRFLDRCTF